MFPGSFHTHSKYCDGKEAPEAYILKAIELGMHAIGFTSHGPVKFPSSWNMPNEELDNYVAEINHLKEKYADKIDVLLSLEMDFIPGFQTPSKYSKIKPDFYLGAIHYLRKFDERPWSIDQSAETLEKNIKGLYLGNVNALVRRYYELVREMVERNEIDVLAHFDLIKKFNKGNRFFDEEATWYKNEVNQTLESIADTNVIVEINTRANYLGLRDDFYPSNWIIKRCWKMHIPLMLSSDAHHPDELGKNYKEVLTNLTDLGIDSYMGLQKTGRTIYEFD